MMIMLRDVPCRLGKAMVERTQSAAGDVRDHAIEHPPSLCVFIEAPVQVFAQEPAALRDAESIRALHHVPALDAQRVGVARPVSMIQATLLAAQLATARGVA